MFPVTASRLDGLEIGGEGSATVREAEEAAQRTGKTGKRRKQPTESRAWPPPSAALLIVFQDTA